MAALQRFDVLYFVLYLLPFPLNAFGGLGAAPPPFSWVGAASGALGGVFERGANAVAEAIGNLLFGPAAVIIQPTGSGDTMNAYVQMIVLLALAALGTAAWSVARRGEPVPPRTLDLFRVYLRYALAAVLFGYGFAKVPPLQFQPPGPELLVRSYGESSPMGLLWTFMGFSPAYTMFAGMTELIPGFLLLYRPTATLGALLGAATMTNVMALNYFYDVPVKLYSTHLWLALLIVAAPDLPRLLNVLVLNRVTLPAALRLAPPANPRLMLAAKLTFIALLVGGNLASSYNGWYQYGPGMPMPPLAGVYDVESFEVNGEARPPLWTDQTRWRRVLVSRRGFLTLQLMADKSERFLIKHDEKAGTLALTPPGAKESFTLTCANDEGGLTLAGRFRGSQIKVALRRTDQPFPINARGFRWVQELPFNR
jgi:hypothetical protein